MVEHDGTDVATLSEFIDDNTFRVLCSTKSWVDLLAEVSKADCDGAADRDDDAAHRAVVGGGSVDAANLDSDSSGARPAANAIGNEELSESII